MNALLLIRDNADDATRRAVEEAVAARGARAGMPVLVTPPLYHLPDAGPVWDAVRALPASIAVAGWLAPRALRWLLRAHGYAGEITAIDLNALAGPDDIPAALPPPQAVAGGIRELSGAVAPRWYPVLDRDLCVQCGQCLQFCVFSVYTRDAAGRVTASNPDACKPGCPACSRICPQGAIIFPLYAKDPAIAGAPGTRMQPDVGARRLYYQRTSTPCARCGRPVTSARVSPRDGNACPECGQLRDPAPDTETEAIDALIDALERVTRKADS